MINTNGLNGLTPVLRPLTQGVGQASPPQTQPSAGQFDQVNISQAQSRESQFSQELVSRLVGDIRTSHTTGTISHLRTQVQTGAYQSDPTEIALRLLRRGEAIESN